ncbi:similar to SNF2/RAD54 family protein (predicted) [Rattus norvegicus]|uniref:DNA excision repair protein ERCC-6-like n=2 Tax=Rattus norvegicus TaxID=10116 RepID=D4A0G9_RAT|nr:DNA excision repair protein ERCC-6-like [Rattus norvegicus]EDL95870.1 similar to SNF2/RAD54 family protein (predicted) [Rattus norvegicus]|eukprot:NP_001092144.1 DNA excision repair protein ERCC-6-like [Rattus norvegicus]
MEASQGLAEVGTLSPQLAESYLRYSQEAKEAAKNGDLEEALKLFNLAKDIFPTKKVISRIQKLQEALEQLAEEEDDEFTDVCNSGLLLYRELYEKLFEHQKEGIAFLYSLYKNGRKGGILADDMGLGKTVQIIAFLSGMFDASLVNHVLLIMPTNLINTWVKEFAKWTPGMRVKTFHGSSKNERIRNLTRIQQRNGVVITTYQMLLNNWQQLASFNGQAFVWDYVILDEAHKIKSASTKSAVCARAVPASNRLLLTGTPIQNNLQELWSLFDFACQGSLLGTLKTFKMEYENPIIRAREKDATPGEKALGFKMSENLMEIIKPYFLRRTKEEVHMKKADKPEVRPGEKNSGVEDICEMLSLTRKNDLIVWIRLVPLQEEIYRKFVSLDHIKELLMETRSPLAELGVLKKLCDHPRLLSARACHLLNLGTVTFSAEDENEQEDASNMGSIDHLSDNALMQESGKMIFLMALLERLQDEGHQTLVFSQSRQILNIIERLLKNKHFKTLRIDGTVTHLWEREKRIQLFQQNKEYSVFLLTTQVGGVGLTLTAASRVVIFDPSWNPATDAQAVDRVYRIGQKENVVVYRLITCGTVEEKIYRRQVFKDSLIRQTTGDKKNPFRYFTKQELKELFTVGDLLNSATQMQLQCLHAAQRKSDEKLDEHIAYLHSLGIAGISDHDLMFTCDLSVKEELDMLEDAQYIQHRVQKAQFLVESESQNTKERPSEENWLKAQEFPSQQRKKGNKPQPQPSRLLANPTQVEAISSQMASISIYDQSTESEPQELSEAHDVTSLQGDQHHFESTSDAGTIASLPQGAESIGGVWTDSLLSPAKGFAADNEAVQKNELQASPGQEALSENLGSFHYLPRQSSKADLEPNLDVQDSVVLYHQSPTANENQNLESNEPMIEISDDLSASPSALQGAQAMEAQLELKKDPLESPPQYECDFNLFLEDSADTRQNLSSKFLEHVEKENSLQRPAGNSGEESAHNLSLDSSNKIDEESEVITVKTKNKARRILSDDEDEEDAFKDTSTNSFSVSPLTFSSVKHFDASTPQNDSNPSRRFFSPKIPDDVNTSLHPRRSLASRRSLINVVLDDMEDMEERLDTSSEEESEPELSEDSNEEAVACTEEQRSGATLASGNKHSSLTESEPTSPAPQSSPCAPEPSSSDPLLDPPQDPAVEAANDYESLVARGKELKECGKTQEALNCLVKALDIKSADPEVMRMTLSLYKQLNT